VGKADARKRDLRTLWEKEEKGENSAKVVRRKNGPSVNLGFRRSMGFGEKKRCQTFFGTATHGPQQNEEKKARPGKSGTEKRLGESDETKWGGKTQGESYCRWNIRHNHQKGN